MKKTGIYIGYLTLILFIFTSCSKKEEYNYTYKGENDIWKAEYKIHTTTALTKKDKQSGNKYEINDKLVVTYQGDPKGLLSIRHLEIAYEGSILGGALSGDYDGEDNTALKTYTLSGGAIGSKLPNKNDVISVTINMDEDKQTIELRYDM